MPRSPELALVLCLVCAQCFAQEGAEDEARPPIIDSIEIVVEDVFDDDGMTPVFWAYRMANDFHFKSREGVIRRELLFAEGDPVDDEALAQTERNLRALPFLRSALVETIPVDDDRVRIRITTSDSWSTNPELRLAKVGNVWVWAVGAREANLFGHGKQLRVLYNSGLDRDETFVSYGDPRVLGSRDRDRGFALERFRWASRAAHRAKTIFCHRYPVQLSLRLRGFRSSRPSI